MSVDLDDLRARVAALSAKAKTVPRLEPTTSVELPARPERFRASGAPSTTRVFGGPPGPAPSEGGCGHASSMRFEGERCSCRDCGATWKLDVYRGKLQWIVIRRAQ